MNEVVALLAAPAGPRAPGNALDGRLTDLGQLTDDERAAILNVINAITIKAKHRLITGGAS